MINEKEIWQKYRNGELVIKNYKTSVGAYTEDDIKNRRSPVITTEIIFEKPLNITIDFPEPEKPYIGYIDG